MAVVGSFVGVAIPGIGRLGAVVLGGATAGYLAGGLRGGLRHGFLTGTIPGLALAGVFAVAIVLMDGFRPLGMMVGLLDLDSLGSVFTVSAFGLMFAITIAVFALAGSVGGVLGGILEGTLERL